MSDKWNRRQFVAAGTLAGSTALAGCSSSDDPSGAADENETETETEPDDDAAGEETGSIVTVGNGSYRTTKPESVSGPPSEVYVAEAHVDEPIPTNSWWSALVWSPHGDVLWSHPLATAPGTEGLQIGRPSEWEAIDDGPAGPNFAGFPADFDFTLGVEGVQFDETVVTDWGDWSVSFAMRGEDASVEVTLVEGSPYVFVDGGEHGGPLSLSFDVPPDSWTAGDGKIGLTAEGTDYGLFTPSGTNWSGVGSDTLTADLGDDGYLTIAALPVADGSRESVLETFDDYAHARVTDTRVDWEYDSAAGEIRTTFSFEVDSKEGDATGTIAGLFPHQHKYTTTDLLGYAYPTPRGRMETIEGESFEVVHPFPGLLPYLPDVGGYDADRLRTYVQEEADEEIVRAHPEGDGVYWTGKNYNRASELAPLARHVGAEEAAETFLEGIRTNLETWLTAEGEDGSAVDSRVFYYDDTWGTMIGSPVGFGADEDVNDHHFHYGYVLRAAATIARTNPGWADESAWGGMVDLLARDFACPDRDDELFPFLRTFDAYAGHSWAGGNSGGWETGNNQESSSEAINAYAALVEWGEYTGDDELRDLGAFLYTQEVIAATEYWFDVDDQNLPDIEGWSYDYAPMVWGSGYHYTTWWTDNEEAIHGINWLPVGGHSLYLGFDDEYAEERFEDLADAIEGEAFSYWPDQVWKYRAFSDATDAADRFEARSEEYTAEFGDSRAHTYHWIATLGVLGSPDPSMTADRPFAVAFEAEDSRTYVAYNPADESRTVTFSDDTVLEVDPETMTIRRP